MDFGPPEGLVLTHGVHAEQTPNAARENKDLQWRGVQPWQALAPAGAQCARKLLPSQLVGRLPDAQSGAIEMGRLEPGENSI